MIDSLSKNAYDTAGVVSPLPFRFPLVKDRLQVLCEIISGFSDGAELAALEVASEKGFITGGCYSCNLKDSRKRQATTFNLIPDREPRKLRRYAADATLLFTRAPTKSRFYAQTGKLFKEINVPDINQTAVSEVAKWLYENRVKVLNVSGATEAKTSRIKDSVKSFLYEVLHELKKLYENLHEMIKLDKPIVEQTGVPIWRHRVLLKQQQRQRRRRRNEVESDYAQFIRYKKEECLKLLSNTVRSWIKEDLDTYPVVNESVVDETHAYIVARLGDYMAGRFELRELLEGYSVSKSENFRFYVTAVTVFHLWRQAACDSERNDFSKLLRHCTAPYVRQCIQRWLRKQGSYMEDRTLDLFLDENEAYLINQSRQPLGFRQLLLFLRRRVKWRLSRALKLERIHGVNLRPESLPYLARNQEDDRFTARIVLLKLFDAACRATSIFPNERGHRLFLLMMLGGLSRRKTCRMRSHSERTKYLVQVELINMLLKENPNFVEHWFRRFFNREIDPQEIFRQLTRQLDLDLLEFPFGLGDRFRLANRLDGWGILSKVSDAIAEKIKEEHLMPVTDGINLDDWASQFNSILRLTGLQGRENNRFDPREIEIASFTKFVIHQVEKKPDGWKVLFTEFAQIQES